MSEWQFGEEPVALLEDLLQDQVVCVGLPRLPRNRLRLEGVDGVGLVVDNDPIEIFGVQVVVGVLFVHHAVGHALLVHLAIVDPPLYRIVRHEAVNVARP